MLVKGFRHPLTREDLWSLNPEDRCHEVYPAFEKYWQREMAKSNRYGPSFISITIQLNTDVHLGVGRCMQSFICDWVVGLKWILFCSLVLCTVGSECQVCLQCFDTVGWVSGRACGP